MGPVAEISKEFKYEIDKTVTTTIEKELEKRDNAVKASSAKVNSSKPQAKLSSTKLSNSTKVKLGDSGETSNREYRLKNRHRFWLGDSKKSRTEQLVGQ